MMRLNADGHDESQYLPKIFNKITGKMEQVPPVNPFRERQGGVKWEGQAIKAVTWMPEILHEKLDRQGNPCLTLDHINTCKSFLRAVIGTRNALGIDNLRAYEPSKMQGDPKDVFFAVMKGLLPYQSNLCLWVVCDEYNRGNTALAMHCITSIQQSLDNAQKIIEDL